VSRDEGARRLRVGLFLLASVGVLLAVVFLLGRSQTLFVQRVRLHARFENTSGLVVGSPVRLAGVDVGIVESIRFDADLQRKLVGVVLGVDRRYLERIREDSVARLSSKGLLGDVLINIAVGSAEAAPLADGATLRSQESEGLTEVIASLQSALGEVRALTSGVHQRLDAVLTEQLGRDLGRIASATADVVEHVRDGDGLTHALVYDRRMARSADQLLDGARHLVATTDGAAARLERILAEVQSGKGTAHALVYRDDGTRLIAELQRTAHDLNEVSAEIRTGHGMLHTLVYERDQENLFQNLTAFSSVLKQLGEDLQQGKGTVGALLRDPSIYEDLKTILGNVKRNRLLKSLVRYTIQKDGLKASP
jgi:phospholipid/cholesterol/gamma-HCH transport system substrate-binding protein